MLRFPAVALSGLAFVWRRAMRRTCFIAITGSVGKTTTTAALSAMLSSRFAANVPRGGMNGRREIALSVLRTRRRHRFTVIETGTKRPGALRRAAWEVNPDVVVVLTVARTHTDYFPTLEHTASEKAELLARVGPRGLVVLNGDDPRVVVLARGCRCRVLTFGGAPQHDVWADEVSSAWPERLSFRAHWGAESRRVATRLVGEHWVTAALAALTAALGCGVDLDSAAAALEAVEPCLARMQPVALPSGATLLRDDFNPTIASFPAALRVLREARVLRRVLVLSEVTDTGLDGPAKVQSIAAAAAGAADEAIFFGPQGGALAAAAVEAGMTPESVRALDDWQGAGEFLRTGTRAGDLVLFRCGMSDHAERAVLSLAQKIGCLRRDCGHLHLCDSCPRLATP
jgi:UDP-N-acetylmuramoyl-tripeptide--D-alanyl-D-alanine ligase